MDTFFITFVINKGTIKSKIDTIKFRLEVKARLNRQGILYDQLAGLQKE